MAPPSIPSLFQSCACYWNLASLTVDMCGADALSATSFPMVPTEVVLPGPPKQRFILLPPLHNPGALDMVDLASSADVSIALPRCWKAVHALSNRMLAAHMHQHTGYAVTSGALSSCCITLHACIARLAFVCSRSKSVLHNNAITSRAGGDHGISWKGGR